MGGYQYTCAAERTQSIQRDRRIAGGGNPPRRPVGGVIQQPASRKSRQYATRITGRLRCQGPNEDNARRLQVENGIRQDYAQARNSFELAKSRRETRILEKMGELGVVLLRARRLRLARQKTRRMGRRSMNFILSERDVLGLKSSGIRSEISGVRFCHLISG